MSMNTVYTKHMQELQTYLTSKLPDMPVHTAQEIAAYIGQKTVVLVNDMLREHERESREYAKRYYSRYSQKEDCRNGNT